MRDVSWQKLSGFIKRGHSVDHSFAAFFVASPIVGRLLTYPCTPHIGGQHQHDFPSESDTFLSSRNQPCNSNPTRKRGALLFGLVPRLRVGLVKKCQPLGGKQQEILHEEVQLDFKDQPISRWEEEQRRSTRKQSLTFQSLEQRNLLASVSFDAGFFNGDAAANGLGLVTFVADDGQSDVVTVSSPSADTIQIQVGNGDSISLQGSATGNSNFVQTANNTVSINNVSSLIAGLRFELGTSNQQVSIAY